MYLCVLTFVLSCLRARVLSSAVNLPFVLICVLTIHTHNNKHIYIYIDTYFDKIFTLSHAVILVLASRLTSVPTVALTHVQACALRVCESCFDICAGNKYCISYSILQHVLCFALVYICSGKRPGHTTTQLYVAGVQRAATNSPVCTNPHLEHPKFSAHR